MLGFTEKEVGRMTLRKWRNLYQHYKDHYDFTLKKVSYAQIDEIIARGDEWFDDEEI